MDTLTIIVISSFAMAVIVGMVVAIWFYAKNKRTKGLRSKFGAEYNRVARAEGDVGQAEQILLERQKRVNKLNVIPLTEQQRDDFGRAWEHEQARFVDDPAKAVADADILVQEVMKVRGYPTTDFEQRVADVSVDHPAVVQNYRIAHDIAKRHEREDVGLEKLREAMLHYRALFADLLHDGGMQPIRQVVPEERERILRAG